WTDPDPSYPDAVARFVAEILEGPDAGPFLKDFHPFQRRVARIGVIHSLSQVLLKLASPGVPDIYQGCELCDLSLVDPDNRPPAARPPSARPRGSTARSTTGSPRAKPGPTSRPGSSPSRRTDRSSST